MKQIKVSLELKETREWEMALENLKEMQPQLTLQLLKDGMLQKTLENRVLHYFQTLERLRKVMDEMSAQEVAQMEILIPIHPDRDQQKMLTPAQEARLDEWMNALRSTTS